MPTLFESVVKWLLQKAGSLIVILAILIALGFVQDAWMRQTREVSEIPIKEAGLDSLKADLARIDDAIARHEKEWKAQRDIAERALHAEIQRIDETIAKANQKFREDLAKVSNATERVAYVRRIANDKKARLDALEDESGVLDWFLNRERLAALELARAEYEAWEKAARFAEASGGQIPKIAPPKVSALESRRRQMKETLEADVYPGDPRLQADRTRKQQEVESLESALDAQRGRVAENPIQRLIASAKANLSTAVWILAGLILLPMLLKVLFYFGLARLAENLPPIRIGAEQPATGIPHSEPSAVSATIDIGPGDELLVHPDFVQSSSRPARKSTQWFLNASIPLSSIASGMVALTRIRPANGGSTRVVVSSTKDPFGEVRVIEIPSGGAMVVQPRSIAGVVKPVGSSVRISREWRLRSPHAWLTLQLRYLVFHGPCKLILKGCRGVQLEEPEPGKPRLISQSATLGFSANLEYSNTRCETFVSYFRGQEDLFNDLFAGGPGVFVYEEMPAAGRNAGITGRGLEGVVDAFLKAFGI